MKYLKILLITWSLTAQAGLPPTTLSGQSASTKPTTFSTKVPYNQATKLNGTESLIETGNENMLINPSFEAITGAEWVCIATACALTNTSSEISSGKAAIKIAPSAGAFQLYQNVNVPSGIQKQGVVGILYNLPASCSTAVISSLVDGAIQTSVPSSNLIFDSKYHSIEIPITFGATSAGIQAQAVSGCTANLLFDAAYVKQGLGTQNLMLDNTYSAQVSAAGVVSGENKDWINGNCSATTPFTCTFNSGIFTVSPNCEITLNVDQTTGTFLSGITSLSSSSIIYKTQQSGVGPVAVSASIICQKSSTDYLASSANVYSQASANYDWTSYTPTLVGFGSPTGIDFKQRRVGGDLEVIGSFVNGTPTAVTAKISLPSGLSIDANRVLGTQRTYLGALYRGVFNTTNSVPQIQMGPTPIVEDTPTSTTDVFFSYQTNSSASTFAISVGTGIAGVAGDTMVVRFTVPIAGWSNSNVIVGSFAGVPAVPGYQGNVDTFSVSYGAGTIITPCATSTTCTLYNQIGTGVSSIIQAGAGSFTINMSKTYVKFNCNANVFGTLIGLADPISCSNCSTTPLVTRNTASSGQATYGTLYCQGTY